jgi:hypothetical protein
VTKEGGGGGKTTEREQLCSELRFLSLLFFLLAPPSRRAVLSFRSGRSSQRLCGLDSRKSSREPGIRIPSAFPVQDEILAPSLPLPDLAVLSSQPPAFLLRCLGGSLGLRLITSHCSSFARSFEILAATSRVEAATITQRRVRALLGPECWAGVLGRRAGGRFLVFFFFFF